MNKNDITTLRHYDMRNKGFTVIELVMVIAIIGIVAVLVFSQLTPYNTIKASSAAYNVLEDIRYAQQLAIHTHSTCGVVFDPSNNYYYVYEGNVGTIATDPFTKQNMEIDFDTDSEFQGIDVVSTNFGNQLDFDQFGVPSYASQAQVVLSYEGITYTVTVEPETGNASVT